MIVKTSMNPMHNPFSNRFESSLVTSIKGNRAWRECDDGHLKPGDGRRHLDYTLVGQMIKIQFKEDLPPCIVYLPRWMYAS